MLHELHLFMVAILHGLEPAERVEELVAVFCVLVNQLDLAFAIEFEPSIIISFHVLGLYHL